MEDDIVTDVAEAVIDSCVCDTSSGTVQGFVLGVVATVVVGVVGVNVKGYLNARKNLVEEVVDPSSAE